MIKKTEQWINDHFFWSSGVSHYLLNNKKMNTKWYIKWTKNMINVWKTNERKNCLSLQQIFYYSVFMTFIFLLDIIWILTHSLHICILFLLGNQEKLPWKNSTTPRFHLSILTELHAMCSLAQPLSLRVNAR